MPRAPRSLPGLLALCLLAPACGPKGGQSTDSDGTASDTGTASATLDPTATASTTLDPTATASSTASDTDLPTTTTPDTSSTAPPDPTDTTGDPPAACACTAFAEVFECDEKNLLLHLGDCPVSTICPTVTAECPRPGADLYDCAPEVVIPEDALNCAITALRDRTPGRFIIESFDDDGGIFSGASIRAVTIRDDARVVVSRCRFTDVGAEWDSPGSAALPPPEHYDGCLAEPDLRKRHACALAGHTDFTPLPLCADAGDS